VPLDRRAADHQSLLRIRTRGRSRYSRSSSDLAVTEAAVDPQAVLTRKRPASRANSFAIPASMVGSRAGPAAPSQLTLPPPSSRSRRRRSSPASCVRSVPSEIDTVGGRIASDCGRHRPASPLAAGCMFAGQAKTMGSSGRPPTVPHPAYHATKSHAATSIEAEPATGIYTSWRITAVSTRTLWLSPIPTSDRRASSARRSPCRGPRG